jgi:hypothetical protein
MKQRKRCKKSFRKAVVTDPKPRPHQQQYRAILHGMTPMQKLEKVFELNDFGRTLVHTGVRMRHPDASPEDIARLVTRKLKACHNKNY